VSDVLGLLCLLPPTRAVGRRLLGRYLARRSAVGVVRVRARRGRSVDPAAGSAPPAAPGAPSAMGPGERVIDGELAGPDEPPGDGPSGSDPDQP
jgi:UPF0716 protein FxsA